MSYSDLLKDPRWQRKRLEVMQRADFKCEHCGDGTQTLNVHHPKYIKGRKPWEYEATELECLCESCHKGKHGKGPLPPKPPVSRTLTLVGGPADGHTIESCDAFPMVWVYQRANGALLLATDLWQTRKSYDGRVIASHFPGRGHPYMNEFMWDDEKRQEIQQAFREAPFPALIGLYGWAQPGKYAEPDKTTLEFHDPDVLLIRLYDLQCLLESVEFDEQAWWLQDYVDADE